MASKRHLRRKACAGKVAHATRENANYGRAKTGKLRELCTYKCPFCGKWHVGHPKRRRHHAD